MPVNWAMFNPDNSGEVILATEVGVWETADITAGSPTWSPSNSGLVDKAKSTVAAGDLSSGILAG